MFGAWQVGAWESLQSVFRPELVVGASVGALNGWLVASEVPVSEMIERWMGFGRQSELRLRRWPGLIGGMLDASALEAELRRLHQDLRPRLPIGVVCTQAPLLTPRLFRDGEITWKHLAASCAVPGLLPAYKLPDGKRYVDGGYLGPAPLWAAERMGATRILAIRVLPPMPWVAGAWIRVLQVVFRHNPEASPAVEVFRVGPEKQLGGPVEIARWRRDNILRWLDEGREAGLRAAAQLREFAGAPLPQAGS